MQRTDALDLKEIANEFAQMCLWEVLISHVILGVQFKTYM